MNILKIIKYIFFNNDQVSMKIVIDFKTFNLNFIYTKYLKMLNSKSIICK